MLFLIILLAAAILYPILMRATLPYRLKKAKEKYGVNSIAWNPSNGKIYGPVNHRSIYD